jgi:hypothetical protein
MPISTQALAAIQAAGAAVFAADDKLKAAAQSYADRVNTAMQANPFDLANDSLFEDWKSVARLSQALARIEGELKQVYELASSLNKDSKLTGSAHLRALAGPSSGPRAGATEHPDLIQAIDATDVRVKKAPRRSKKAPVLAGNAAKLLTQLQQELTDQDFVKLNRSRLALSAGLPKGSINAAIRKLLAEGRLLQNVAGALKLV